MSTIKAIAIRNRPRIAMQSMDSAQISVDNGIHGEFKGFLANVFPHESR